MDGIEYLLEVKQFNNQGVLLMLTNPGCEICDNCEKPVDELWVDDNSWHLCPVCWYLYYNDDPFMECNYLTFGNRKRPGRPTGSKGKNNGVRFTPTVKPETLEWINDQPLSQGKTIDMLVNAMRNKP